MKRLSSIGLTLGFIEGDCRFTVQPVVMSAAPVIPDLRTENTQLTDFYAGFAIRPPVPGLPIVIQPANALGQVHRFSLRGARSYTKAGAIFLNTPLIHISPSCAAAEGRFPVFRVCDINAHRAAKPDTAREDGLIALAERPFPGRTRIGAFFLGLLIAPLFARASPFGCDGQVAAVFINADLWGADAALMKAQNPDAWYLLMAAPTLTADNAGVDRGACRDASAKSKKEQPLRNRRAGASIPVRGSSLGIPATPKDARDPADNVRADIRPCTWAVSNFLSMRP